MTLLLEFIPGARNEDKDRFIKYFSKKIEKGEIKNHTDKFNKTKSKIKKLKDEKGAEEERAKLASLQNMIMKKHTEREGTDLFDMLIDKYANGKKDPKELKKKDKSGDKKQTKKINKGK